MPSPIEIQSPVSSEQDLPARSTGLNRGRIEDPDQSDVRPAGKPQIYAGDADTFGRVNRMRGALLKPLRIPLSERRRMERGQTWDANLATVRVTGKLQREARSGAIREVRFVNEEYSHSLRRNSLERL